ncbi:hypothetical protein C1J02_05915 [Sulfitobacter sp. SK011]|nr:hypothetical protein C1J02_05915 [Sulfitobacter sp. SK011]
MERVPADATIGCLTGLRPHPERCGNHSRQSKGGPLFADLKRCSGKQLQISARFCLVGIIPGTSLHLLCFDNTCVKRAENLLARNAAEKPKEH